MIQMDERSISEHLKKHCMDNSISIVRSILEYFSKPLNSTEVIRKCTWAIPAIVVKYFHYERTMHFDIAKTVVATLRNCRPLSSSNSVAVDMCPRYSLSGS
jgi:hypothetical protein